MPVTTIWTALPREAHDGQLRLGVFVSFRATTPTGTDAPLSTFHDLIGWPDSLAELTFEVQVDSNDSVPAVRESPPPSNVLWKAVFPKDRTMVRSHQPQDFSGNPRRSFSVLGARAALRDLYAHVGALQPGTRPSWNIRDLATRASVARLAPFGMSRREAREFVREFQGDEPPADRPDLRVRLDVAELISYYASSDDAERSDSVPLPSVEDLRKRFDFHAILASLGDHPALLQPLGLAFDLS